MIKQYRFSQKRLKSTQNVAFSIEYEQRDKNLEYFEETMARCWVLLRNLILLSFYSMKEKKKVRIKDLWVIWGVRRVT